MQDELLAQNPRSNVRGFAVWFSMYPGDAKTRWPGDVLTDVRFAHRWDESKTIGRFFLEHLDDLGPYGASAAFRSTAADALWDAYLLFDAKGAWTGTMPEGLVSWGATVLRTRDRLAQDLRRVAGPPNRPR